MILQGKKSNYDTDVFQPTIQRISQLSGKVYGADAKCDVAMRVIADHLRAIAFSIADGQLPSNVKAGYVIRRILRRAVRYGYTYLGFTEPTICKLVPGLVEQMGEQFPELKAQQSLIEKVIEEEEASFLRTLATGINLLDGVIEKTKGEGRELDFGQGRLRTLRYVRLPDRPDGADRPRAGRRRGPRGLRNRTAGPEGAFAQRCGRRYRRLGGAVPASAESLFTGYDTLTEQVRIARYRRVTSKGKTSYQLVFDRTPFYGNSGGQIGDIGYIENADERIAVVATEKENGLIIHIVEGAARKSRGRVHGRRGRREAAVRGQQPYGHAPHARGAAQGPRHSMSSRKVRW